MLQIGKFLFFYLNCMFLVIFFNGDKNQELQNSKCFQTSSVLDIVNVCEMMIYLSRFLNWHIYDCGGPAASFQYTVSLVQWVNRSLPAQGAAVPVPGMHPHLQWNRALLLAMPHYIGDPDVIPDHQPQQVLFAHDLAMTLATGFLSHALPSSILLLAGPPPSHNAVTR